MLSPILWDVFYRFFWYLVSITSFISDLTYIASYTIFYMRLALKEADLHYCGKNEYVARYQCDMGLEPSSLNLSSKYITLDYFWPMKMPA